MKEKGRGCWMQPPHHFVEHYRASQGEGRQSSFGHHDGLGLIFHTYIIYTIYNVLKAFRRKLRTQKGVVGVMPGIPRPACETFFENFFLGVFSPYMRLRILFGAIIRYYE
jgi:hypothetical protein